MFDQYAAYAMAEDKSLKARKFARLTSSSSVRQLLSFKGGAVLSRYQIATPVSVDTRTLSIIASNKWLERYILVSRCGVLFCISMQYESWCLICIAHYKNIQRGWVLVLPPKHSFVVIAQHCGYGIFLFLYFNCNENILRKSNTYL